MSDIFEQKKTFLVMFNGNGWKRNFRTLMKKKLDLQLLEAGFKFFQRQSLSKKNGILKVKKN